MSIPPGMPSWALAQMAANLDPPVDTSIGQHVRIMADKSWLVLPHYLDLSFPGATATSYDDGAVINWAANNIGAGGMVRLIAATYDCATTIGLPPFNSLQGMPGGAHGSVLAYVPSVAGDCIRWFNPASVNQNYAVIDAMAGAIRDLTVDGNAAPAGSVGIHAGDMLAATMHKLFIRNFTGSGGIGLHLDNTVTWTEKLWAEQIEVANCTSCITIDVNGGTNSYEYNRLLAHCYVASGQTGVSVLNGAQWNGPGGFLVSGNVQAGAAQMLLISGSTGGGAFSKIYDCPFFVRAETGALSSPPVTVNFGSAGNNLIQQCHGALIFAGTSGGTWADAVNATGSVDNFRGRIFDNTAPTQPSKLLQAQGQQSVSTPGVPLTATPINVTTPVPVTIYLSVSGMTWTAGGIQVNGTGLFALADLPGTGVIPFNASPGQTITLNYSAGTLNWFWVRLAGY